MRPTWIVLGVVVGLSAVAYVKLRAKAGSPALARAASPEGTPSTVAGGDGRGPNATPIGGTIGGTSGGTGAGPGAASGPAVGAPASAAESEARALVASIRERSTGADAAAVSDLEKRLETAYPDTMEARRYALPRAIADANAALDERRPIEERVAPALRARASLSRALVLPEHFDASTGRPTERREALVKSIVALNAFVMTKDGGVAGVTRPYVVAPGDSPLRIVSREKLTCGPAAILFWSQGGNLDPKRLRVGDTILLPLEVLSIRVDLERQLLGIYLGDALVKEHRVGVGKSATPTYPGVYRVTDKYLNPDWHSPTGVIPYGDPKNELGDAWIPISSPEHPKGYGIHGTNKPDTVGTYCSNGCVRLRNEEAVEMTSWVRTDKGGEATRVHIR